MALLEKDRGKLFYYKTGSTKMNKDNLEQLIHNYTEKITYVILLEKVGRRV